MWLLEEDDWDLISYENEEKNEEEENNEKKENAEVDSDVCVWDREYKSNWHIKVYI